MKTKKTQYSVAYFNTRKDQLFVQIRPFDPTTYFVGEYFCSRIGKFTIEGNICSVTKTGINIEKPLITRIGEQDKWKESYDKENNHD